MTREEGEALRALAAKWIRQAEDHGSATWDGDGELRKCGRELGELIDQLGVNQGQDPGPRSAPPRVSGSWTKKIVNGIETPWVRDHTPSSAPLMHAHKADEPCRPGCVGYIGNEETRNSNDG